MSLLKEIKTNQDIKNLTRSDLDLLAFEIRERIIDVVSKRGGHLASSLGAVELTIAMHRVFDFPKDTLVWDVGHQSYAHKLLTGREDSFDTLRSFKGISGFTKMSESPYDGFTVGHASTSISAGLGISIGKCLTQNKSKVVAVIGDGSLTAGLAYEALNQAGDLKKDLIVILNDNEMSISPNVGALSSFLSRTLSASYLQQMRKGFGEFLKSLPKIGFDIYRFVKKSEGSFKTFVTPGMLFEAFEFNYFGPIDGHNLNHLIDILHNIKTTNEPVLLHVMTKKGKGYEPAEKNPIYFHGVGAFDIKTGNGTKKIKKVPTYTEVFGSTMLKLAQKNKKIVAVTAAMPEGTGLADFAEQFPDRFFDVGIAEQHAVTFAAGLATQGLKPVVAIYSTFLQRAYDQILHDVCIDYHNVVFAIDRGGIVGEDGPTHHGLFDYAYLRSIPNITIMAPKDENELGRMLTTAMEHKGPISIRYPRGNGEGVELDENMESIEIGKAELLEPESIEIDCDVLLIAIGHSVVEAIKAIKKLKENNITCALINARFVKPLDKDLILMMAKKVGKVITIEDHVLDSGFGSAVLELFADNNLLDVKIKRIGINDCFVEHGPQEVLRYEYGIDSTAIYSAVENIIKI
ncbi:MAG: 1-deoxy-D-xylulose-5-phosphate synthase [Desulfobacterales bacterium]|nr:1-deoxy-D-xylulose-5-phosphate synthase [Desulfobacterales bacterium]